MNRLKQLVEEQNVFLDTAINSLIDSVIYPTKPTKPILAKNHNIEELKLYNEIFEQYIKDLAIHNTLYAEYITKKNKIECEIEEYLWEITGLNEISEQYSDKVWSRAWNEGHSYGYYEVYLKLLSLVEIFN